MSVNDDSHDAEYWDEYIQDFGVSAYVEVRYVEGALDMEQSAQGRADICYSNTEECRMCGVVHPC